MNTFLSLCMIVKNEEHTLARCLDSVQGLVDEIIIVDTGSTDATKEIATKFSSKVYDFTWTKDFSAARNESIQKATGKWILILDADEYVQKEEHSKLKEFLLSIDSSIPQCFLLPIMNIVGENESKMSGLLESSAARLFPNSKDIYFSRPIHEQLTYRSGKLKCTLFSFTILHSGYTDETVTRKEKSKRNLEIFEDIQQTNQKLDPYYYFTLGTEYSNAGDHKKAIYYYERAYKRAKPNTTWMPHCIDFLVNNYMLVKDYSKTYEMIEIGLQRWGNYSDYHSYRGYLYDCFGFYDLAKTEYLTAIDIGEEASRTGKQATIVKTHLSIVFPSRNLAQIYYREQNMVQTVYYLSKVLNSTPQDAASLFKLITILSQSETDISIIAFLEKIYPLNNQSNILLLFRISVMSASTKLAQYYFNKTTEFDLQLGESEMLDYSLLTKDLSLFNRTFENIKMPIDPDSLIYKFLLLGILTWGVPEHYAMFKVQEGHTLFKIAQSITSVLNGEQPAAIEKEDIILYKELIIHLFELQVFEAFDLLMNHLSDVDIINSMADHFYSTHQLELAIDYYSILLKDDLLYAAGYENLAYLRFNQDDIEQGLEFLEKALDLNPSNVSLYTLFSKYSTDLSKKKLYKEKFIDRFPRHKGLPFIASI